MSNIRKTPCDPAWAEALAEARTHNKISKRLGISNKFSLRTRTLSGYFTEICTFHDHVTVSQSLRSP
ncbi:MAG: hypothetical protein NTZ00_08000 [Bacteroidetes bacterium]|nr:hypothetical protein [Bacteroidota bacterium]